MSHAPHAGERAGRSAALFVALALASASPGLARPLRVVASDARGVTLEVTIGAWSLSAPGSDGRVRVNRLDGSYALAVPGRPTLPAFAATLALPPDGRPSARVIASSGDQSREGVHLEVAGRPAFRDDGPGGLGLQPTVESVPPIADGPWPASEVELFGPYGFRGRRLVSIEIRPFRYDESTGHVSSPLTLTVRVDFNRPAGASLLLSGAGLPDPHVDGVLEGSVLNWSQAQGWRVAAKALGNGGSLFARGTRPGGAPPGAGAAQALGFDEDQPEVRVKVPDTGLYRLTYDNLARRSYPGGVPVSEVSVHRHEFLEDASPPYATVDLPCEVEDANGNGVFDSGDGIWVWVRNWAERSGASPLQRFWGDAEVVFVTRKIGGGLRTAQRPGWINASAPTPLASYPSFKHYEKDFAPIMGFVTVPADTNIGFWHWTDLSFYYDRPDTIRIQTNDLDTSRAAAISVRWVGRKGESHFMWAGIKNGQGAITTVVDSTEWFGKEAVVSSSTFPGSVLTEGNTNFFRQWGKNGFGPPDQNTNNLTFVGLDWFELTYWRRYRAVSDYVRFNTADASDSVQMQVGGFGNDSLRVYDVTDPDQPVRVTIDPAHVSSGPGGVAFDMQDVVTSGARREYVAAALQRPPNSSRGPLSLPLSAYSAVTRRNLWANTTGDYLLVSPEAFLDALPPLEALRTSQGLSVLEAPIESIYDEFNGGRHSAAALQRFAKYAFLRWDSRFLTLMGDGSLDPNNVRATSGPDWIPVLPSPSPVGVGSEPEIIPSDNRYGFITGNDDPYFGLNGPVVPELMVGRLTVNSLVEADSIVAKLVRYENVKPSDAWRRKVLLNADDAYSGDTFFGGGTSTTGYCHRKYEELFVTLNNTMQAEIEAPDTGTAGMHVRQFNLRYYLPNGRISVGADTCRLDRSEAQRLCHASVTPILIDSLSAGQLLWNYQGHANEFVLTHEDLYVNSSGSSDDALRLQNDDMPFIFTAFSCHANEFADPEHQFSSQGPSLGEDLLALPRGRGAIASWASVGFEVVPRNGTDHINVELLRDLFVSPPRDEFLGADDRGARAVLGEVILSALIRYVRTVQNNAAERGIAVSYTLLGDPATRISIGQPISQVLANGLPVTSGAPLRLHTLGDTLRIDANVVSVVRIDSLAMYLNTGAGDVALPVTDYTITPPLPDTAAGTGVFGGRHFQIVYKTQPGAFSADYVIVARDRGGLVQRTDVRLQLDGVLRVGGVPIADNDEVPASAALSFLLLSPAPIANPLTEITLTVNGVSQAFAATPAPGDASGREWVLAWSHADYPIDEYTVVLAIQNGGSLTRRFRVTAGSSRLALRDLIPFPNPFDNGGTHFSFLLTGTDAADVKIHVFTLAGRSIYTGVVRGLAPGYHQLAWDGRDAEGDEIANGVYFYRVSVTTTGGATTQQLGRLVKLRKPRRVAEPATP